MKSIAILINPQSQMNANYSAAIQAAGASAVMIGWDSDVNLLRDVDGVVISGGIDINPMRYGEPNTASVCVNDKLDDFELRAIDVAVQNKKPVLGVCRGHQLLNVFFGGTLIQNISHCEIHKRENNSDKVHDSTVQEGSFLHKVYCCCCLRINSAHHQAVKVLGSNLKAVQHSPDGIIEAFEHETLPVYGVQWHPERTCLAYAPQYEGQNVADGLRLFDWFLHEC